MSGPPGLDEAGLLLVKHLGDSPRAAHSRFVGAAMAAVARRRAADAALWEVVGLLHDIDYPTTKAAPERHGPLAAEWLAGRLPDEALLAIAAHDHHSGITSDTAIADALKLADAIAVLDERKGRAATVRALATGAEAVRHVAGDRPYLARMIVALSARLMLPLADIASVIEDLPSQR